MPPSSAATAQQQCGFLARCRHGRQLAFHLGRHFLAGVQLRLEDVRHFQTVAAADRHRAQAIQFGHAQQLGSQLLARQFFVTRLDAVSLADCSRHSDTPDMHITNSSTANDATTRIPVFNWGIS
jgi:hypothetical protein